MCCHCDGDASSLTSHQTRVRDASRGLIGICVILLVTAALVRDLNEGMRVKSELGLVASTASVMLTVWWLVCSSFRCFVFAIG